MAHISKFLARDIVVSIDSGAGSGATGSWVPILGLDTITHAPTASVTDTTDFNSNGRAEHIVTQRGDEWTLAGHALMSVTDGARDPGQQYVEALGQEVGIHAEESFQMSDPGGHTISFKATAEVTLHDGGHNDAAKWQAKLSVTGPVSYT